MEATSIKLAGYSTLLFTREIVILRSSKGWRRIFQHTAIEFREFIQKQNAIMCQTYFTGLWITAASCHRHCRNSMVRSRNGSLEISPSFACNLPATECILVVSRLSPNERGGKIEGRRLASMDFPLPGAPMRIILCPPAAATSNARFTFSCPFTSAKSRSKSLCCA